MFNKNIILGLLLCFSLTACSVDHNIPPVDVSHKPVDVNQGKDKTDKKDGNNNEKEYSDGVKKFNNLDELKDFLSKGSSESYSINNRGIMMDSDIVQEDSVSFGEASMNKVSINGASNYSETNTQVKNVDEADIVKTDGEYVYTVSGKSLFIVKAYEPENSKIVSEIKFKSQPSNIYINGDKLIIHGVDYDTFRKYGRFTFLKVFDISDKKNPKQVRDLSFEGNYFDSRMIGDYVYFVTTKRNYRYGGGAILPRIAQGEKLINNCNNESNCIFPNVYYFDIPYNSYNFTTISSVNVKDDSEEINSEIYVFSNSQEMYVSAKNIYITYTQHLNQYEVLQRTMHEIIYPKLSDDDQNKVDKIDSVEDFILNKQEKLNKVSGIMERYMASLSSDKQDRLSKEIKNKTEQRIRELLDELEKTIIHKIAINKGSLEYKTSGEVKGYVLNQFSMDEKDGYFRIATTKNKEWSQYLNQDEKESYSNLYVLDQDLKVVGSVEKIAQGEKIYSVRFMQNRAYMVTFEQIDPLFVIDLADPKNPNILGKLKVPGYSNYLHPYDDNILIGLGKDTGLSDYGSTQTKGVKLSMFDVSDVNNLKEIDTYVISEGWSDSIALHDHKAFLFSKDKNLLVIPVNTRDIREEPVIRDFEVDEEYMKPSPPSMERFTGALVFHVDENGFKLKGKINHQESNEYKPYYSNTDSVKRSLYIEDMLYTFSESKIKINKLEDLSFVKDIDFINKDNDFEIIN